MLGPLELTLTAALWHDDAALASLASAVVDAVAYAPAVGGVSVRDVMTDRLSAQTLMAAGAEERVADPVGRLAQDLEWDAETARDVEYHTVTDWLLMYGETELTQAACTRVAEMMAAGMPRERGADLVQRIVDAFAGRKKAAGARIVVGRC